MKADELRAAAQNMTDPSARIGMLNAARTYDEIANNAEARLQGKPDHKPDVG
jgi:hypothetical protein